MTSAPNGLSKSDGENEDAIKNAKEAARKASTNAETAKKTPASTKKASDSKTANPEGVSKPGDEQKTTDRTLEEENGEAQFTVPPAAPGPNDPLPEGQATVSRRAELGQPSDPSGNVTETVKIPKTSKKKKDVLAETDMSKLPVAVSVGQITASVEEYAGNAVLSLSLVGWVGDAPMKIRASDIGELEGALAELRKQLS